MSRAFSIAITGALTLGLAVAQGPQNQSKPGIVGGGMQRAKLEAMRPGELHQAMTAHIIVAE